MPDRRWEARAAASALLRLSGASYEDQVQRLLSVRRAPLAGNVTAAYSIPDRAVERLRIASLGGRIFLWG